jgi:predicted GH43/DUF377 family glycosyl hydrolase
MLIRHGKNPILEPKGFDWEGVAVFNPTAVYLDGRIHLLYRAVGDYWNYASSLGHAVFDEDLNLVERDPEPCFGPDPRIWEASVEDARLTEIEGELFMTYVITPTPFPPGGARVRLGIPKRELAITRIGLARVSRDFKRFERLGIITPYDADERDTVLFPERIDEKYAALHRPSNWIGPDYGCERPGIWFAYLDDLPGRMYGHHLVMAPEQPWESYKIGPGAPPIKTGDGWLLIYHGVDEDRVYRAGAALLDPEEPWRVIARTREPILVPEEPYELEGDMPRVVFPEGAVVLGEKLFVFYGAADKVCCVASVPLREVLNKLSGKKVGEH